MIPSDNCISIIKQFEGFRAISYKDIGGVYTIGYGSTYYKNGERVKGGERISLPFADDLLRYFVGAFARGVSANVKSQINQNQFDSLVSFSYNVGLGAFSASTLLKKVNILPSDPTIRSEFEKWKKVKGFISDGLWKRRRLEADLYFKQPTS